MAKKVIVIGSGAAGMSAASAARAADPEAEITVFTEDKDIAYSPCMIPWVLEGRSTWDQMIMHTPEWYAKERNIKVLTETKVESAVNDRAKDGTVTKTVTAGGKTYEYDSLVLATGGRVFVPPIEGTDLPGVFVVRTVEDGRRIEACLKKANNVVIAGAGVIGLEIAIALNNIGKDVTIIEMMDQVIPRIADADMAGKVQKYLEGQGVKIVLKAPVQKVVGNGKVEGVESLGKTYPADLVIFATGVRANTDLAKQMGLDIGQLGAVAVAPTLQCYKRGRLVPDVFACGDVIQCQSAVYTGPTMSQLGSTCVKEGKVAGANAVGKKCIFGPTLSPWVSSIGEMEIAGTGMSLGLASWYGADTACGKAEGLTRARYYPGAKEMTVKVIGDRTTHRIIGCQIVSGENATGRIDWMSAVIAAGTTAEEFLANGENAYCPPTAMVREPVFAAVEDLVKNLKQ
jgi:NADH oxidase (H2O2-forming)